MERVILRQAGEPSDLEDESDEDEAEEASRRALSVPAARSALHAGLTAAAIGYDNASHACSAHEVQSYRSVHEFHRGIGGASCRA